MPDKIKFIFIHPGPTRDEMLQLASYLEARIALGAKCGIPCKQEALALRYVMAAIGKP